MVTDDSNAAALAVTLSAAVRGEFSIHEASRMQRIRLRDGRSLAWREYGDREGYPVLFAHGNLNSRLFQACWDREQVITEAAGARVIAVDRPGYGDSDYVHDRHYLDWGRDIEQLMQYLELTRFAVLGFSSGGPNAMACAVRLENSVAACGLVSSDGPYQTMAMTQEMNGKAELDPSYMTNRAESIYLQLKVLACP